jgi:hypothetical protein
VHDVLQAGATTWRAATTIDFAAARTEGRVGAAIPDEASSGLGPPVDLDLRYILSPHLRTACGLDYFQEFTSVSEKYSPTKRSGSPDSFADA